MIGSEKSLLNRRVRVILLLFMFLPFITILRAYQLQFVERSKLAKLAEKQHLTKITIPSRRGVIYDRDMNELAISVNVDSIYAQPFKISNPEFIAEKISSLTGIEFKDVLEKLKSKKRFVWIKRRIPLSEYVKAELMKYEGIGIIIETKRYYPNKELAGQVIGFEGTDSRGLAGIEYYYDELIGGKPITLLVERDATGEPIFTQGIADKVHAEGYGVVLTISRAMQHIVERELKNAVEMTGAKRGMAIVMRPKTGEIIALANYPFFDPNAHDRYSGEYWKNRVVSDSFEPGSTFKAFLIAAALNEGVVKPTDKIYCENGTFRVANAIIRDVHPYGWLTVEEVIKYSSNIGASKIGERLGASKFYDYIRLFGFGEKTGIDLPGEATGLVPAPKNLSKITLSTVSFGQGISVTAIQLINALSAIANGGKLMKPFIVKKILDRDGRTIKEFHPQVIRNVISEEVSKKVKSMLSRVVEEGGTGQKAALLGYRVAGKTGTAQKVESGRKGYSPDKRISSFMGFVPVDDPELAILVVIDEPKGIKYGGIVAAPVFKSIAYQCLSAMNLPARESTVRFQRLDHVDHREREQITKITKSEQILMPDFTGLSIKEVLEISMETGIDVKIVGSGIAVKQYPPPGTPLNKETRCVIEFSQPF